MNQLQKAIANVYLKDEKPKANRVSQRVHRAINWNDEIDAYTLSFWDQNIKQMWVDTEFVPVKDKNVWSRLDPAVREAYKKVLAGLTLLDTKQGTVGMPKIAEHVNVLQHKAVLSFMGMMENIHAKSYSTIFITLLTEPEINEVFDWVENDQYLQFKAEQISHYYENITDDKSLYKAMMASVFLESFLFYSGFFLPLYLAGQGQMVASGEIINKIIQDESIHGVYVGLLAQEIYNKKLTDEEREEVDYETYALLDELMENEFRYTESIYSEIGLDHEVKDFLYYNANKALMNLGKPTKYEDKKINPIVQNGLNTESGTHDFFSTKGKSYQKAKHRPLTDKDFDFSDVEEEEIV
ncbi:class 1b ribonucleoside-diphosphate reductase subunit beta [Bacillus inaquosorum]|uniref:class 1b ribonucleoside-diphosphate reductase subunit beta n=1 Tax=Bacillus inaquosorum TaxID=483913 RepID=UPI00227F7994|nr:class 1b ribonucleoside-diphosphate reductase subunit beta [Bacillus inaquosorum]MCY7911138.1 class 1b ribonucleoside-diphosphate reductase subunit beta [Bacillus inaquosorum]MED3440298.1 class 1b ribonucleoside-diphosphate reductase subunit beta [Bacillus subtilis]MED3474669.1 class 1b ribonucleoside-diphosphate reductase subunit beta [Bacillus subtilis]